MDTKYALSQETEENMPSSSDGKVKDIPDTFLAEDGGDIKSITCEKNPGHKKFIPVTDFTLANLPEEYQNDEHLKTILLWADLTVKIKVKYVSKARPETYKSSKVQFPNYKFLGSRRRVTYGSGYVFSVTRYEDIDIDKTGDAECPCLHCERSETSVDVQSWYFTVVTSIHVIFDSTEAERSIIECFYDSDETRSDTAKYLYGIRMYEQIERNREKMAYVICVTHDKEFAEKLQKLIKQRHDFVMSGDSSPSRGPAILISHPHGCSKTVTVGHVLHLTVPTDDDGTVNKPLLFQEETECILPYSSLSKVPILDFSQAHGIDLLEPNNSDLTVHGDSDDNSNISVCGQSNQTDALDIEPPSDSTASANDYTHHNTCAENQSENGENQTENGENQSENGENQSENGENQSENGENQSENGENQTENGENQTENGENLSENEAIPSHSNDSPSGSSESDTIQSQAVENISQISLLSLPDKENTDINFVYSDNKSIDLEGDDKIILADGSEACIYYVDDSLEGDATLSIPDPDHLISLTLPPHMTFTIPDGAEFARRYDGMKALFHFPPGTKFYLSSGNEVYFPQEAHFYCNNSSIQTGYMSYKVDSCPSSSGGCMLLDGGNSFIHTFPHAGSLPDGGGLCGLRCYPIMPSAV